jgi:hypothetical protein
MKMVKSAFLASAAGLVAMSGAQAADLPVKAKPVEYVKVCSLYGAGFYYIPGTDICMKIGGYVRFQESAGSNASISFGPLTSTGSYHNREASTDFQHRVRAVTTFDTRQQTAYGTLRTYLLMGFTNDSTDGHTNSLYSTRAFIQIAGFTFGKATSFFDFVSTAAVAYNAGFMYTPDTGDGGHIVAAYTAQFGNGLSATISAEQERRRGIDYLGLVATGTGAIAAADIGNAGILQGFVGNVRVDQAWGSAQLSAAIQPSSTSYYGAGAQAGLVEWNGHPSDEWGWAVSAGLRLNAPMFGAGDYFQFGAVYSEGAVRFAALNTSANTFVFSGQSMGISLVNDGGFTGTAVAPGIFEQTTAWSVYGSYEHFWTPALRTSLYGSYLDVSRSDALNNAMCTAAGGTTGLYNLTATVATSRAGGCDLDSSRWAVGSRSQWNITRDLYVGLDVIYNKLNSGSLNAAGTAGLTAATAGKAACTNCYATGDQDAWVATWRIHRDIVP